MPNYIIHLKDKEDTSYYMEWSYEAKAPISRGMSRDEFRAYYLEKYGPARAAELDERMRRVDLHDISGLPSFDNLTKVIINNKAGDNGASLSYQELVHKYCKSDWEIIPESRMQSRELAAA